MITMTRQERKAAKQKAWIATPPAHIAKPLRHIGNRLNGRDAKGNVVPHPHYVSAYYAAQRGDGLSVQQMARSLN